MELYHDFVLVRPDKPRILEETSLVLPDTAVPPSDTGKVLAKGPGAWKGKVFCPTVVSVGMRVLFEPRSADKLEMNGESFLLLREPFVFAELL